MNSESFGEYIRKLRQKNKLSLRIVASEIDIDQSTLSKIERTEKLAPKYIVKPLARLFDQDYRNFQIKYLSDRIYHEVKQVDFALEAIEIAKKRLIVEKKGTKVNNKRALLLEKLTGYLKKSPIEKAWLFGSFARDEAKFDSDIDLLIKFKKSVKLDLLDFIGISYELEDLLERNVDLVQEGTLTEQVGKIVNNEKVLIYG